MGICVDGFGISGYRSFGKDLQRIGPLSKINIFAGQNNSGKSNILNYLMSHYGAILNSIQTPNAKFKFDGLDIPMKNWDRITRVGIGITHNSEYYNNFLGKESLKGNLSKSLDTVLKSNILSDGTNVAWLPFEAPPNQGFSLSQETIDRLAAANLLSHDQWQRLWMTITSHGSGGGLKEYWIPKTLTKIVELIKLPTFSIIPSIRRYSAEKTDKADDYSGLGIIDKLAKLQNPSYRE